MPALRFDIQHRCASTPARTGVVHTPHGSFATPAFMPVGTRGTVKGLLPKLVAETGSEILLNNTYHLLLRPGPDLVEQLGGVHRFMCWNHPILTDSGGYQAFSMADINAVDDEGVTFKSIVDGSDVRLTPAEAIRVQNALGADIIMAFDDCPPSVDPKLFSRTAQRLTGQAQRGSRRDYDHARRLDEANERTVRWLETCKQAHARPDEQALFGIVQGGTDLERRSWSVQRVCGVDLPGYAIGGVAVGEGSAEIEAVVRHTAPPDARGQAPVSHGRGVRAGPGGGGAGGRRHVRLRAPNKKRTQRQRLHQDGTNPSAERPLRRRPRPHRGGLRLPRLRSGGARLGGPHLQPGLPAAPLSESGNVRANLGQPAQHPALPTPHVGHSPCNS